MESINNQYVVEWSEKQGCFHINDLKGMIQSNYRAYLAARIQMPPTPATRDYKGANGADHMKDGERSHMGQLPNAIAHGKSRGLKLHSDFVSWMMGYPLDWLDLPETETESKS